MISLLLEAAARTLALCVLVWRAPPQILQTGATTTLEVPSRRSGEDLIVPYCAGLLLLIVRYTSNLWRMLRIRREADAAAMARSRLVSRIERVIDAGLPAAIPRARPRVLAVGGVLSTLLLVATLQLAPAAFAYGGGSTDAPSGSASNSSTPLVPRVLNSSIDLVPYYPAEARRASIEGFVDIAVTLDAAGRPTDTEILTEYPADVGFGAAASALVHDLKYSNPTGHPAQVTIRINFTLGAGHGAADAPQSDTSGG